jgi:NAD(P)-dependent dehydrogenase (short-subunit alcohol dehydrogenase family)
LPFRETFQSRRSFDSFSEIKNEDEFREQQEKTAGSTLIALAATFLASDDARWITGQVIVAAGGKRM